MLWVILIKKERPHQFIKKYCIHIFFTVFFIDLLLKYLSLSFVVSSCILYYCLSLFNKMSFSWLFPKHFRTLFLSLTLCGTRKLQFFYSDILPEFKNRPMPKTVNAICKQIIKVKKII